MRPVEMTGIVNRTTDFAQVRQNEDQKPVMEQAAFQTQFNKQVEKNSDTVVKKRDSIWFLCQRRLYTRFRHRYNDSGRSFRRRNGCIFRCSFRTWI